jgi:hypothetical protein
MPPRQATRNRPEGAAPSYPLVAYIGLVVSNVNPDSEVEDGIFGAAYALRDAKSTSKDIHDSSFFVGCFERRVS